MRTIVSKFGGSSVANAKRLRDVLEIVRASPARRCVVLSAPGLDESHDKKVTELLDDCWNCRNDPARLEALTARVAARYSEIATELSLPDMDAVARREIAVGLSLSRDHTLSRGEYLCALLFSRYSGIPMLDASNAVRFDRNGNLDEAQTRRSLREAAAMFGRFLLPGFYGADPSGQIRVFPRNGSDITGALAAARLDAGLYENWTDVPGLMTADPAVVPEARLVRQVCYRQMRALARAGAQVLHPACLDPVALAGIPTRLRDTLRRECFGTLVVDGELPDAACIASRAEADGATISVFGVKEDRAARAFKEIGMAPESSMNGTVRGRVTAERYAPALRQLHRRLIEEGD